MSILFEVKNLSGGYAAKTVIKDVTFSINKGDFLGIIGPNGSGKSTLLKIMSKALTPASGCIKFDGEDIRNVELKQFCRKVSFVPQETLIDFAFSVQELTLMGRIPHLGRMQFEGKIDLAAVEKALSLTQALPLKERLVNELSAGERQRVFIARALAQEPVLIFLDEPTAHLDIGHQIQILDLLKKLNRKQNLTIVMVIHDLNLAGEYCDRLILLNEGRIFKEGPAAKTLTYQNIEAVYKTVVVVRDNPISGKPYVIAVSTDDSAG